jgi:hypothetical protein
MFNQPVHYERLASTSCGKQDKPGCRPEKVSCGLGAAFVRSPPGPWHVEETIGNRDRLVNRQHVPV